MKRAFLSRRLRNPHQHDEPQKEQPFFSKANDTEPEPFFGAAGHAEPVQAKLAIGQPGDKYEQEADAVADQAVNGQNQTAVQRQEISTIQCVDLTTPQEDEKLGTAEARMEKDKLIQEKPGPGVQLAPAEATPEKKEKPVQMQAVSTGSTPEKKEKPVQMQVASTGPTPEKKEKPVQMQPVSTEATPDKEEKIQAKAKANPRAPRVQRETEAGGTTASPHLSSRLQASSGKGKPLPGKTRAEMESAIGTDFSGVNIHTDRSAVEMNEQLGAQAFTHGQDVYFNSGKYHPESADGKKLLAHELTHVVQQCSREKAIQRTIGDGHDLASPRFSGDEILEACFDDERFLRMGDRGPAVTKLQIALTDDAINAAASDNANPLARFGEDGIFGSETKAAVRAFQARSGLPKKDQDGIVGPITMGLLDQRFPPVAGSAHSQPTPQPADKKTVTLNFTVLFGSNKSVSNALNVANVLYAPANIQVRAGRILHLNRDQTEALIGPDLNLEEHTFNAATDEERNLFQINQEPDVVSAYFVQDFDSLPLVGPTGGLQDKGFSIGESDNFGIFGLAVRNGADDKTFAHELGHILRGSGHIVGDPNALMAPGGPGTQFSAAEIATMRTSHFAK